MLTDDWRRIFNYPMTVDVRDSKISLFKFLAGKSSENSARKLLFNIKLLKTLMSFKIPFNLMDLIKESSSNLDFIEDI